MDIMRINASGFHLTFFYLHDIYPNLIILHHHYHNISYCYNSIYKIVWNI